MKKLYSLFAVVALAVSANAQTYSTGFETVAKGGYGPGNEVIDGFDWQLDGVLKGDGTSDFKVGTKSLRMAGAIKSTSAAGITVAKAEMITAKANGIGQIQFQYRQYGNDAQIPWGVEYFDGAAWVSLGSITGTATEQTAIYTVNNSAATKIRIIAGAGFDANASVNGKRLNVDELKISDNNVVLAVADFKKVKGSFVKNTFVENEVSFGSKSEINVYNMNGQVVKSASVSETKNLDTSDLNSGNYIITGTVDGKPVSQKIIKK